MIRTRRSWLLKFGVVAYLLTGGLLVASEMPDLSDYVVDRAGVFEEVARKQLAEKLRNYEEATTNQVVVVIMPSVPRGERMEDFTLRAANMWGVGQKGQDNGVVFFVFPADRQMRIEVGTGLGLLLSDEVAVEIIEKGVIPIFKEGDLAGGVKKGVDGILEALQGKRIFEGGSSGIGILPISFSWVFESFGTILLILVLWVVKRFKLFPASWEQKLKEAQEKVKEQRKSGGGGWGGGGGFSGGGGGFSGRGGSGRW
jgi:uncharacterized protein